MPFLLGADKNFTTTDTTRLAIRRRWSESSIQNHWRAKRAEMIMLRRVRIFCGLVVSVVMKSLLTFRTSTFVDLEKENAVPGTQGPIQVPGTGSRFPGESLATAIR